MAGRPRGTGKPTAVKVLEGTVRARDSKRIEGEPQPPAVPFPRECPAGMTALARAEWRRVVGDLIYMRTPRRVDARSLVAYCESVSRFRLAVREIDKRGILVSDPETGKLTRNPAVQVAERASTEMRHWAREFGFTPAARTGIQVHIHAHPAGPADRYLGAVGS